MIFLKKKINLFLTFLISWLLKTKFLYFKVLANYIFKFFIKIQIYFFDFILYPYTRKYKDISWYTELLEKSINKTIFYLFYYLIIIQIINFLLKTANLFKLIILIFLDFLFNGVFFKTIPLVLSFIKSYTKIFVINNLLFFLPLSYGIILFFLNILFEIFIVFRIIVKQSKQTFVEYLFVIFSNTQFSIIEQLQKHTEIFTLYNNVWMEAVNNLKNQIYINKKKKNNDE